MGDVLRRIARLEEQATAPQRARNRRAAWSAMQAAWERTRQRAHAALRVLLNGEPLPAPDAAAAADEGLLRRWAAVRGLDDDDSGARERLAARLSDLAARRAGAA